MGQLMVEKPDDRLGSDGAICNEPRSEGARYLGDKEAFYSRLASYGHSPYENRGLARRLARGGFYYTGSRDVVKCHRCGQCVQNFLPEDNPQDQQWHMEGCDEVDSGRSEYNPGPMAEFHSLMRGIRGYEHSSENRNMHLQQRQMTQQTVPGAGARSQNQEFGFENWSTSTIAQPSEDEDVYEMFACLDPFVPDMSNLSTRIRTFNSGWNDNNVNATREEIARAGFFYTGTGDRVICWYCNGSLENFEQNDNPWEEHAKWFPNCEYLLRHRGPDYVHSVVSRFQGLSRHGDTQFRHPSIPQQPAEPVLPTAPRAPAAPRPPAAPRAPRLPRPPRLPQPPAPPVHSSHSSEGTVILPGGITLSLAGGEGSSQGSIQVFNGGSGQTFTIRTRRGTTITYNYGGNAGGATTVVRTGRNQNLQPPQFVDPRQEEQRGREEVDREMENSPFVAAVKSMGFEEETIRIVLLSKFLADGRMFESVDDLVDTLTQYQDELARIEAASGATGGTAGSSRSGSQEEQGAPAGPEETLRRLEESRNCRLCHQEPATVVLMPCAHLAVCVNCSSRNIRVCPVCKRMVTETIRSYIS